MSTNSFVDYFGAQVGASRYASFRPIYPESFIATVVSKCRQPPKTIIDIGCGTGQATLLLAAHAENVIGMDPSPGQVKEAQAQAEKLGEVAKKLRFVVGGAEDLTVSGVAPGGVDLITAAQCAHWFDLEKFYVEAKAAMSEKGSLALWCYTRPTISNCPDAEAAFQEFYAGTMGVHWPTSRKMIDDKYTTLHPPFKNYERFEDAMYYELTSAGILDYISTWSALQVAKKTDPERDWTKEFREALQKQPEGFVFKITTPIYAIIAHKD